MHTIDYAGTYTLAQLRELRDRRIAWNTGTPEEHAAESRRRADTVTDALNVLHQEAGATAVELAADGSVVAVLVP
jgi:hypothetical protein